MPSTASWSPIAPTSRSLRHVLGAGAHVLCRLAPLVRPLLTRRAKPAPWPVPNTVGKWTGAAPAPHPARAGARGHHLAAPAHRGRASAVFFRKDGAAAPGGGRAAACGLAGRSPAFRRWWRWLARAGRSTASVLLQGEPGTGKTLAAHVVHPASAPAERPLVVVDCAALPKGLLGSLSCLAKAAPACPPARGGWRRPRAAACSFKTIQHLPASLHPRLLQLLDGRHLPPRGQQRIAPGRCAHCGHHQHRLAQPSAGAAMARCAVLPPQRLAAARCRRCANGGPMLLLLADGLLQRLAPGQHIHPVRGGPSRRCSPPLAWQSARIAQCAAAGAAADRGAQHQRPRHGPGAGPGCRAPAAAPGGAKPRQRAQPPSPGLAPGRPQHTSGTRQEQARALGVKPAHLVPPPAVGRRMRRPRGRRRARPLWGPGLNPPAGGSRV